MPKVPFELSEYFYNYKQTLFVFWTSSIYPHPHQNVTIAHLSTVCCSPRVTGAESGEQVCFNYSGEQWYPSRQSTSTYIQIAGKQVKEVDGGNYNIFILCYCFLLSDCEYHKGKDFYKLNEYLINLLNIY